MIRREGLVRVICAQGSPGEVVKPDAVMCVKGEGMPNHKNPFIHGRNSRPFVVPCPVSISTYSPRVWLFSYVSRSMLLIALQGSFISSSTLSSLKRCRSPCTLSSARFFRSRRALPWYMDTTTWVEVAPCSKTTWHCVVLVAEEKVPILQQDSGELQMKEL